MANATLLSAFFAETAIITYRQYQGGGVQVPYTAPVPLPLPSTYTAPIVFFGALALIPASGATFAGLVGWGIVVATLLNLWNPSGQVQGAIVSNVTQQSTKPAGPGGTSSINAVAGPNA